MLWCAPRRPLAATRMRPIRAIASAPRWKPTTAPIYAGCNVENASYGLTICAERAAVCAAVAAGARRIRRAVVITDSDPPGAPCGACRQVLAEFGLDMEVTAIGSDAHACSWTPPRPAARRLHARGAAVTRRLRAPALALTTSTRPRPRRCQERLTQPGECPELCPGGTPEVLEEILEAAPRARQHLHRLRRSRLRPSAARVQRRSYRQRIRPSPSWCSRRVRTTSGSGTRSVRTPWTPSVWASGCIARDTAVDEPPVRGVPAPGDARYHRARPTPACEPLLTAPRARRHDRGAGQRSASDRSA